MPTGYVKTWIYLGTYADMDPNEGDSGNDAENANTLVGVVFDGANTAFDSITLTNTSDDRKNGKPKFSADHGNDPTDHVTYDLGGAIRTSNIDSIISYNAEVLLGNGSLITPRLTVIQLQDGTSWIREGDDLDNRNIQTIKFTSVYNSHDYSAGNGLSVDGARFVCFTRGCDIRMADGTSIPIQDLRQGDLLWTKNAGHLPVRWIGSRRIGADALRRNHKMRAVRIPAHAFGLGFPYRDLCVSRHHRIYFEGRLCQEMFGVRDILVPAKDLIGSYGIGLQEPEGYLEYYHILLDRHAVILSNNLRSESLLMGEQALLMLGERQVAQIQQRLGPSYAHVLARHRANLAAKPVTGQKARRFLRRLDREKQERHRDIPCAALG